MRMAATIVIIVLAQAACLAQDEGLVAHYTFDALHGQTLPDVSGSGADGVVNGATLIESPHGRALRFDGVDDYIELGAPDALRLAGDLTVEAWVRISLEGKIAGERANGHWLIFGDASGLAVLRNYNLRVTHQNKLRFEWGDEGEYDDIEVDASFLDGEWHHLAAVAESASNYYLYLDGELLLHRPAGLPITRTNGGPFRIGGWGSGFLRGDIDEVRLYSRALSSGEIRAHAQVPAGETRLALDAGYSYASRGFHAEVFCEDMTGRAAGLSVGVTGPDGAAIARETHDAAEQTRPGSQRWSLDLLLPAEVIAGDYVVRCAVVDADGVELASQSETVPCTERPAWLDSKVGASEWIPPPFEPVAFAQTPAGLELQPWGRRMLVDDSPVLGAIDSAGARLLARPIAIVAQVDDEPVRWVCSAPRIVEAAADRVVFERECDGGALRLLITARVEYDGFLRLDWRVRANRALTLQQLIFELPVAPEAATHLYAWPSRTSGALTEPQTSRFRPLIFLSTEERGLCWTAESDEGWRPASFDRAMEILPGETETLVRMNIIGRDTTMDAGDELGYSFGLIATPVRPMARTMWEARLERQRPYADEYAWIDGEVEGRPALERFAELGARGLLVWRWWDAFSYTLPLGHEERFPELVRACHERGLQVVPYAIGFLFSEGAPEARYFTDDFVIVPRREWFIDRLPGLDNQMTWRACRGGPWQDWALATTAQCMDEYDTDGVYLDGTTSPEACMNRLHGCGYVRPDGRTGPTFPVFETREFMKRLYTIVKSRKPDGHVDAHVSGCYNVPAIAFTTATWNGEHLGPIDHLLDRLPLDMFRTEFMGHNVGVPADLLYYRMGGFRRCAGLALLHDVPTRAETLDDLKLLSELWRVRGQFGCEEAQFTGYWAIGDLATASPEGAYVSIWRRPESGVLAVIDNLGREAATVHVRFDLAALGLVGASAIDAISGAALAPAEGAVSLDLDAQDWRLVWLQPHDMAAAPGPVAEGAALANAGAQPTQPPPTRLTIETTKGPITVELFDDRAPITAGNFLLLAESGFYNGMTFHRFEPGFVIQGGDPLGDGTGGPGFTIPREIVPGLIHERGTLSMARRIEPDTAGSQFFICLTREECACLDGGYAAFGRVIEGMDVVDRIRPGDRMIRVRVNSESPHAAAARQAARAARVPD